MHCNAHYKIPELFAMTHRQRVHIRCVTVQKCPMKLAEVGLSSPVTPLVSQPFLDPDSNEYHTQPASPPSGEASLSRSLSLCSSLCVPLSLSLCPPLPPSDMKRQTIISFNIDFTNVSQLIVTQLLT